MNTQTSWIHSSNRFGVLVQKSRRSQWVRQSLYGRKVGLSSVVRVAKSPKLHGNVAEIVAQAGYVLTPVREPHLCCGSEGTYSILQPIMAEQLRDNKLSELNSGEPDVIVTANIGYQQHLEAASGIPVRHNYAPKSKAKNGMSHDRK